jgi:hypothetical protein
LIVKGHCDICDYPKDPRKPYSKWDTCPKDKGRLKMNCTACSKGLIHCPEHPDKVKDGCDICYYKVCEKHPKYRKEACVNCAIKKRIDAFINKGGEWKF